MSTQQALKAKDVAERIHTLSFFGELHWERVETKRTLDRILLEGAFGSDPIRVVIERWMPTTPTALSIRDVLLEAAPDDRREFEAFMLDLLFHLEADCGWQGMYRDMFRGSACCNHQNGGEQ